METLYKIIRWVLELFKVKVIVVWCITRNKFNVITNFGGNDNFESFFLNKTKLIRRIQEYELNGYKVIIRTNEYDKIDIVDDRYLISVKDENKLKQLPSCI